MKNKFISKAGSSIKTLLVLVSLFSFTTFAFASQQCYTDYDGQEICWETDTTEYGNFDPSNSNIDYVNYHCATYNCGTGTSWDTSTQINCPNCGYANSQSYGNYNPNNSNIDYVDYFCNTTNCGNTPGNTGGIFVGGCEYYGDCTTPSTTTYVPNPSNTTVFVPYNTNTYSYYPTYNQPSYNTPSYSYSYYNPSYTTRGYTYPTTPAPTYNAPSSYNNTYAPVYNTNTTTNTNTNINNTCAGQNNCNINTNTTFTTINNNNSINGSFNTTYAPAPTYNQPTPVCTNGATNYPSCNTCPTGLVYRNGYCVVNVVTNDCPANYTWNGTSCVPQTKTCPNGTVVSVWDVCPNQTQTCWNGTVIPVSSVCPSQYKTCPNGTVVLISQQCYKTCSNGTTVPDTQICYRICPNGQSIPEGQYCPVVNNYPTVDININPSVVNRGGNGTLTWTSQNASYCTASNGWSGNVNLSGSMIRNNILDNTTYTITCYNSQGQSATDSTTISVIQQQPTSHRVVTTSATQVTNNSARCNGIGIISNGVMSNGWFEYGETTSLGRVTNSASIGSAASSPFSNTLSGLKSNTTYYCRAVMSNANGTYRGEIVSFKTSGSNVTYIPVTPKTTTKKTVVVCTDDTGAKESLADGEKLMSITLDKRSGNVVAGGDVEYRAHYLNTSKIKLTNVTIKIVLPSEMTYVSSNRGMYDQNTNTVTADLDTVGAGASGDLIVRAKVNSNVEAGKSAVISSYISYDALDQKGKTIRDENTSYIISTINSKADQGNTPGATTDNEKSTNKTVSGDRSYLPNTVLEWLAIIALIFVLIVLGKAIWAGIKGEGHSDHH